jgi:hypothetical protein
VVKGACKNIVADLFIMIEGQAEDELPERVSKCLPFCHSHLGSCSNFCSAMHASSRDLHNYLVSATILIMAFVQMIGGCRFVNHDLNSYKYVTPPPHQE